MDDWITSQHLPTNLGFNAGCWFSAGIRYIEDIAYPSKVFSCYCLMVASTKKQEGGCWVCMWRRNLRSTSFVEPLYHNWSV